MPTRSPLADRLRWLGPWVDEVDARSLRADAGAALLAALLVLPQGLAFAALAGLPPVWGIYSAVVPTIVAALAGSSRHVLTGPTNALSLALAASLAPLALADSAEYLRLALVVTLMIGVIQLAVALLRMGVLTNFIAPSVLLGFTTGAALLIARHALHEMAAWPRPDAPSVGLGLATAALALGLRARAPRWPSLLIALVAGSALGAAFSAGAGWPLTRVGTLPQAWPSFAWPAVAWADLPQLAGTAAALTLVALGQSIAIAKSLAQRSGQVLDVNRECLGQGLANTVGAFFSCFASCGSINRSLPHLQAGARTPLAGAMAGIAVLPLVALAAPLLAQVPMPVIGGLLLAVAWSLVDRTEWRQLIRLDPREAAVAAATLVATVLLPIPVAVLIGVASSFVLYLHRTAHPALRTMGFAQPPEVGVMRPFVVLHPGAPECPQLKLLRMEGSVWFGAEAHVAQTLQALRDQPRPQRHLLVMGKSMNFIDLAGAALWERERIQRRREGGDLYFHRPRPEVMRLWQAMGFVERLGAENLFADKRSAIAAIVPKLDGQQCASCTLRVFEECARQPGGALAPLSARPGQSPPGPVAPPAP